MEPEHRFVVLVQRCGESECETAAIIIAEITERDKILHPTTGLWGQPEIHGYLDDAMTCYNL